MGSSGGVTARGADASGVGSRRQADDRASAEDVAERGMPRPSCADPPRCAAGQWAMSTKRE
jgi:hypothetical protein